jgi:NAD+ synthase (glutamine-hydrolysing)
MDGDTAGGLSPIAGIDKAFIRRWLVWLEHEGLRECGPISALSAVTAQAPTAELRPSGEDQTDEADLMPYELLDVIERASIADKRTPADVFRLIEAQFPAYSTEQLLVWLERFYALFCRTSTMPASIPRAGAVSRSCPAALRGNWPSLEGRSRRGARDSSNGYGAIV